MATYFNGGSEIEAASTESTSDGMQTLLLMNSNYVVPYSHTHHQSASSATNIFLLNPAGNALSPTNLPHAPPHIHHHRYHHLLGANSDDPHHPPSLHGGIVLSGAGGVHLWGSSVDHQNSPPGSSHHPQVVVSAAAAATVNPGATQDIASQLGLIRPAVSPPRQGNLSLSLSYSSPKVPQRSSNVESSDHIIQGQPPQVLIMSPPPADDMTKPWNSPPSAQILVLGSKYLRAAQQLLDEVVNVGKSIKTDVSDGTKETTTMKKESMAAVTDNGSSGGENGGAKRGGVELTTAQKQELQMKKAKLVTMLDEVEQRYRRYHLQMQIVAYSFEQVAGFGAAKSYTTLALGTISKQFRCLKDAISGQIEATSKSLGEVDYCLGTKLEGSRLRYVDQQIRQQRAVQQQQQLGMIQHSNAWRPHRGLPERAVSVLRAWLFEHFLHPYPKVSEKHLLAKQTGLTRSQVSNWFINARVRLWKPMVEDMYMEEVKEQERNCSTTEDNNGDKSERKDQSGSSSSSAQQNSESIKIDQAIKTLYKLDKSVNQINGSAASEFSTSAIGGGSFLLPHTGFNLIVSSAMDDERLAKESLGFATYGSMGEIVRFDHPEQLTPSSHRGNSVSLTLGLPHCENLSLSGNQQNLVLNQNIELGRRRRLELGTSEAGFSGIKDTEQASHSSNDYENNEMQNKKLLAAQLLPDFVIRKKRNPNPQMFQGILIRNE